MIHSRFPLLFMLCFTCLGLAPNASRETLAVTIANTPVYLVTPQLLAQAPSTDVSATSGNYDRAMQAGYEATQKRDYQAALEHFKKALSDRPNDVYAQQAVRNLESYITRDKNRSSNLFFNFPWMLIGLAAISAGIGGAFLFFLVGILRQNSKSALPLVETYASREPNHEINEKVEEVEEVLKETHKPTVSQNTIVKLKNESTPEPKATTQKPTVKEPAPEDTDKGLPVQPTTRLANVDLIDTLIEDLQQPDPRKRRKAIWDLAQKADSRAMKPLVDLMIDADSHERGLILEALSQISTRTLKPMQQALAISLQDNNPQVRKNAIRDTTKIYDLMTQISQMLCHAMEDSDTEVQETAKWAFNQLNLQMPRQLDALPTSRNSLNAAVKSYTESSER